MKKTVLIAASLFLFCASVAVSDVNLKYESLAGIKLGDDVASVVEKLGEPEAKSEPKLEECCGYSQTLSWTSLGMEIILDMGEQPTGGTVSRITVREPSKATTSNKIGIGASSKEVRRSYRRPDEEVENIWIYVDEGHWRDISFYFENDKVVEITFGAMPE